MIIHSFREQEKKKRRFQWWHIQWKELAKRFTLYANNTNGNRQSLIFPHRFTVWTSNNSQMMSTICCRKTFVVKSARQRYSHENERKERKNWTSPVSQRLKSKQQHQQHLVRSTKKNDRFGFSRRANGDRKLWWFSAAFRSPRIRPSLDVLYAFAAISQHFSPIFSLIHTFFIPLLGQHKVSITYLILLFIKRHHNNKCWHCDVWHMLLWAANEDSIEIQLI